MSHGPCKKIKFTQQSCKLPKDIAYHIILRFIGPSSGCILVDKYLYQKYFHHLILNARKIQRFTRRHVPYFWIPPSVFDHEFLIQHSKGLIIRMYMQEYPLEHLQTFPELLIQKANKPFLQQWVQSQLPLPFTLRTKSQIRKFFQLPDVSFDDITITGW